MIDFLRYRYICLGFSVLLFVVGIATFAYRVNKGQTGFNYHVDFVGGTELNIKFEKPIKIDEFRSLSKEAGWEDLTIQSIGHLDPQGGYREFIVRLADTTEGLESDFKESIAQVMPSNTLTITGIARVGAEVGRDIQWNSFVAVLLSLLLILLYVSIRYEYRFAIGAVVALAHDLLAVLVIFLLLGEQISVNVLAAILAILGYSINDTIVIFSRINENMKKLKGVSEEYIVNLSINQTLRRTLFTSITTLLTVLAILFLGGEALYGFALAMAIGIVFGTYSSIYIASPVMLAFSGKKDLRK